jgi:predicted acyl esterase
VASDATIESIDVNPEADDPCRAGYPYLAYATELFPDGIDVVGTPTADMRVSTDAADVDVFVAFYDYLEGAGADTSVIFAYGGARARFRGPNASPVVPGEPFEIHVDTFPVAYRLRPGARVVASFTPGACGRFENPQTGEPLSAQTAWNTASLSLHLGEADGSRVQLPLLDE